MLAISLATFSCEGFLSTPKRQTPLRTAQNSLPLTIFPTVEQPPEKLWSLLQKADGTGYVILFRHALAPGVGDPPNFQLNDCSTQRNLSEEGRRQAVRLGEVIKSRKIPVARVLSSQWCRCRETAQLMDVGKVESFPPLNSFFDDRTQVDAQTSQVRQFLWEHRHQTGVTIMISHQVNILALLEVSLYSGEGVVLRVSDEPARIEVLGQLSA
jgi:phosphohistidine phosphatase SixA